LKYVRRPQDARVREKPLFALEKRRPDTYEELTVRL
jgi:hypothetical protein